MVRNKAKSRYCKDKKGNLRSRYCVSLDDQRVHISCQDVNFHKSLGMICVWQVFGDTQDFTSIADTFIFEFVEIATIRGSRIASAEV